MQDGSLQLVESLFSRAQESVKLDLSYCGLESTCIRKFTASVSLVHGILELNLGGNPIMKEVCSTSVYGTLVIADFFIHI